MSRLTPLIVQSIQLQCTQTQDHIDCINAFVWTQARLDEQRVAQWGASSVWSSDGNKDAQSEDPCDFATWQIPACVCKAYAKAGIKRLFDWQVSYRSELGMGMSATDVVSTRTKFLNIVFVRVEVGEALVNTILCTNIYAHRDGQAAALQQRHDNKTVFEGANLVSLVQGIG